MLVKAPDAEHFDAGDKKFTEYLKYLEQNIVTSTTWHNLSHDKINNIYWQLDKWDKYQRRLAIKLLSQDQFPLSAEIQEKVGISFLEELNGISGKKCQWKDCNNFALNQLVFCSFHAYTKMGMR